MPSTKTVAAKPAVARKATAVKAAPAAPVKAPVVKAEPAKLVPAFAPKEGESLFIIRTKGRGAAVVVPAKGYDMAVNRATFRCKVAADSITSVSRVA